MMTSLLTVRQEVRQKFDKSSSIKLREVRENIQEL